jgi:hypothetical protein
MFDRASYIEGASMFGPDISRWPIVAVDAAVTLQHSRNQYDIALKGSNG